MPGSGIHHSYGHCLRAGSLAHEVPGLAHEVCDRRVAQLQEDDPVSGAGLVHEVAVQVQER